MILSSFGEPVGAKIGLGASCGTLGPPKGLPEIPRVPFWSILNGFWGHFECFFVCFFVDFLYPIFDAILYGFWELSANPHLIEKLYPSLYGKKSHYWRLL